MGGGVSSLSPDMASELSDKRISTFREFENECTANNMAPVEVYLFLTSKYNLLLTEEKKEKLEYAKETSRLQAIKDSKRRFSKPSVPRLSKITSNVSSKNTWGQTKRLFSTSDVAKKSVLQEATSVAKTASSDSTDSEMGSICLSCVTEDSDNDYLDRSEMEPELSPIPEERHVEGDEYVVHDDKIEEQDNNGDEEVDCHPESESVEATAQGTSISSAMTSTKDDCSTFECKICNKRFGTRGMLETHISYSQLHANAVQERAVKFAEILRNAERQAKLARTAVQAMRDKLKMRRKVRRGQMTRAQFLWKNAVSKVIDRYLKARYYDVLAVNPKVQFPEYHATHSPERGTDAKLLYNGSKFYWRIRATYKIDLYLHARSDVIEVVPQLVQSANEQKKDDDRKTTNSTYAEWNCPRIYLSRAALTDMMTHEPHLSSETSSVQPLSGQTEIEEDEKGSDYESDYDSSDDEDEDDHSRHSRPSRTEKALSQFILSHLKVDFIGVNEKRVSLLQALYFDTASSATSIHTAETATATASTKSVLLDVKTSTVSPVAVESTKVYQQWEVRQKLSQVQDTQQSLTQAVRCAYMHAKQTTKILSPKQSFHLSPRVVRSLSAASGGGKGAMFSISPSSQLQQQCLTPGGSKTYGGKRWSFKIM